MKKAIKILVWTLVVALFAGTFYFLYRNSQPKTEVYAIVRPERADIKRTTVLTGKIEPRDEINVKPQISGIITEINVEPGQMVSAGDVIARIKVIPEASQLSAAENRVKVARINLQEATDKHERNASLYTKKIISREDYETTLATLDRAKEELAAAIDAVAIVRNGVSQYNASESNTMVRATTTGLVLDVPVKVGSSVIQANTFNDGTTIATIADMNNLIFKGNVDETEVGNLKVGMPMTIEIGASPDVHPVATIEYISPKGKESNGANTFEIKAAITLENGITLRAGYSANAIVSISSVENALAIPEAVVEWVGDSTFVYCLTDSLPVQKFERRSITTGISDGLSIEVTGGIDSTAMLRGAQVKENESVNPQKN